MSDTPVKRVFKIGGVSVVETPPVKHCKICKKQLDTKDPLSEDCGGDCLECVREAENAIVATPMPMENSVDVPTELIEPPVVVVEEEKEKTEEEIEAELLAKLQEIQAKRREREEAERKQKEEERKKAELIRPITVRVTGISGAMLNLSFSILRVDVMEYMRTVPNRSYNWDERQQSVPASEWKNVRIALEALENVEVLINKDVEDDVEWMLNAPVWEINKEDRFLTAKAGPGVPTFDIYQIPGASWKPLKKWFEIPLTEAYKLFETLANIEGVVWSDEAREFAIEQVEARGRLDKIASATDHDYEVDLKNGVLRTFQKVGCGFIEAAQGRALIAYEMGLGKTWIALAYAIKNNFRVVIIVPAALKNNWAREVYKLSGIKPNVLQGSEPTEYDMVQQIVQPSKFTIINYDLLGKVSKYENIKKDEEGYDHVERKERFLWAELINLSKPDLVIFDESHYIKNTDSNRSKASRTINCQRVIHMTGTPVLNRPGELWPMLTMLAPSQFPSEEAFLKQYTYDGKRARNVDELRNILKTVMIRRLKKDVIADMPLVNRINDYHELSPKALKIYRKVEMGVYEAIDAYKPGQGGTEKSITSILTQIQRLKQVCAIDKIDETADLAVRLYDQTDPSEKRKVLIFTQYKAVARAIAQRLGNEALSFVTWNGSDFKTADGYEQDRLVQQFQTDSSINYLVVTEKTAKEGHNITEAGHVIFNDLFWTPAGHAQAEGRAYGRLSDLHGINAYYRITDMDGSSIEEWIMDLLAAKLEVIEQVVEGVEASRSDSSIVSELIDKMRGAMWTKRKK